VTVTGRVRLISISERTLVIGDGSIIPLDGIAAITGKQKSQNFRPILRIIPAKSAD